MDDRQSGLSAFPFRYLDIRELKPHTLDQVKIPEALWGAIG